MGKYKQIPKEVIFSDGVVSSQAAHLYLILFHFTDDDLKCKIPQRELREYFGVGTNETLKRHIDNLEELGLIEIDKAGSTHEYYLPPIELSGYAEARKKVLAERQEEKRRRHEKVGELARKAIQKEIDEGRLKLTPYGYVSLEKD